MTGFLVNNKIIVFQARGHEPWLYSTDNDSKFLSKIPRMDGFADSGSDKYDSLCTKNLPTPTTPAY